MSLNIYIYIALVTKEASNICIPDLFGYHERCPTGSFINSDIRKSSGYIKTKCLGYSFSILNLVLIRIPMQKVNLSCAVEVLSLGTELDGGRITENQVRKKKLLSV